MKGWTDNTKFDWSGVTKGAPPPASDGVYLVKFDAAVAEASSNDTPMLKLGLEIIEDAKGVKPSGYSKRLFDNLVFTQNAAWKIMAVADAAGIDLPSDNSTQSAKEFGDKLMAATKDGIYVRVKQREYQSKEGEAKVRAEISRYLTADEAKKELSGSANGSAGPSTPARRPRSTTGALATS